MKDYFERIISEESVDKKLKVTRRRNSNGTRNITITFNARPDLLLSESQSIIFESESLGDEYEQIAAEAAEMLLEVAGHPCLLPDKDND